MPTDPASVPVEIHAGDGLPETKRAQVRDRLAQLSRYTDEPIKRIAARVGYDEIAYFSRCFRNQVGQSPRAYRRAWQQPSA